MPANAIVPTGSIKQQRSFSHIFSPFCSAVTVDMVSKRKVEEIRILQHWTSTRKFIFFFPTKKNKSENLPEKWFHLKKKYFFFQNFFFTKQPGWFDFKLVQQSEKNINSRVRGCPARIPPSLRPPLLLSLLHYVRSNRPLTYCIRSRKGEFRSRPWNEVREVGDVAVSFFPSTEPLSSLFNKHPLPHLRTY